MAWESTLPPEPPVQPGWWVELSLDRWVAGVAAEMRAAERAARIERCRQLAHDIDMRCAGAMSADRWEQIQRRHDRRFVRSYGGQLVDSWGAGPEVEHSAHWGRILEVR